MNLRLPLLLSLFFALSACGIKGDLKPPAGAAPPSIYERVFGAKPNPAAQPLPEQDNPAQDVPGQENLEGNEP